MVRIPPWLASLFAGMCCVCALAAWAQAQPDSAGHAALIEIDGAIGPATSAYFEQASTKAIERGARLIVLQIDTPGGLDTAMREMIKRILASPVPVVAYVAPGGARAASAGTYLLYASHVAAMAPATNVGAATPVPAMGGGFGKGGDAADEPRQPEQPGAKEHRDPAAGTSKSAMEKKVINDAVAYIRSLAEQRGRNADWAEQAVREGASLSARDALQQGVVDLIAPDLDALLASVDGREVQTSAGTVRIESRNLPLQRYEPGWRFDFLSVLTNPTIAYIFMLAGIYGLLLEGYNPGAIVPGVVGAICLLLALFAFQILPVNYVGLGLMLLGIGLMIAEAFVASFGVLGLGGVVAFVFGSVMLMDIDVPGYGVNIGVIAAIALAAVAVMVLTLYLLWRSRRAPVTTGDPVLLGHLLDVEQFADGRGWGRLGSERWQLASAAPLSPGDRVRVVSVDGLTLSVEPVP